MRDVSESRDELLDRPGEVRAENALDLGRLMPWLREHLSDLDDEHPEVAQYAGGASNLTYALRFSHRTLILRRPPSGTRPKSGHDMAREFRVMRALHGHFPVPTPHAMCEDESVIGAPFYLMDKLEGIILRRDLPDNMTLSAEAAADLCRRFWQQLIDLHQLDANTVGLGTLGRPEGYVARQVAGWNERYARAATDDAPDAQDVMRWLTKRQVPENGRASLIHNDYRFDNVVLSPDARLEVIGVLDWEMCTLGDPLMDLGGAMAYWIEACDGAAGDAIRMQPSHLPGMLTRDEVWHFYERQTGISITDPDFYLAFGLFRLAAIAQQIYFRYANGQTSNPRYAAFGPMVHTLVQRARQLMQAG